MIKLINPKQFSSCKKDLELLIQKDNPIKLLEKFTGRKWSGGLFIKHKKLDYSAEWQGNKTILIDFENKPEYCWLCICHELAHLFLRHPPWYKNKEIKDIIKQYKDFKSKKYYYDFQYAIEQTLAFFLQAACKNKAELRSLKWSEWKDTFKENEVLDFAKILWKDWLLYLKNLNKYKKIDEWILKVLRKYY